MILALAGLLLAAAAPRPADAQDAITRRSIDSGGATFATGGSYTLGGTIGQPDAGTLSGGAFTLRGGFWFGGQTPVTGVGGDDGTPALAFRLYRGPNPVRSASRVAFDLPSAERAGITIFDVGGRVAKKVDFGAVAAGHHVRSWKAEDDGGRPLPTGVYWLRLETERERATQKVLVVH